jgi:hypothetical protein
LGDSPSAGGRSVAEEIPDFAPSVHAVVSFTAAADGQGVGSGSSKKRPSSSASDSVTLIAATGRSTTQTERACSPGTTTVPSGAEHS